MSIIKDINELHINLRTVILSVATLMPFWYLDIFLFSQNTETFNRIEIPIIMSFCLSVTFFGINVVSIFLSMQYHKINTAKKDNTVDLVVALTYAIMSLSLWTIIWYFSKWNFSIFALSLFGFMGVKICYYRVRVLSRNENPPKNPSTNSILDTKTSTLNKSD
jgi:hypothetical protein